MPILRLLSYNIRSLRDDSGAVSRVIRAAQPDVVCIQEAPRFFRWRATSAAIARRSGMVVVGGGRPAAANLMLSSLAVDVRAIQDVLFTKDRGLHQRGTSLASLSLLGRPFVVAGTHLDLEPDPRLRHVAELHAAIDAFAPVGVPAIVAGDINETPDSPAWAALAARGVDAFAAVGSGDGFTYSALAPMRRIDGVFVAPEARVVSCQVLDSADVRVASDHRPVLVEIDLGV
ncbi:MAG: endonuclease/exonuclease/phosphatase family protein [Actinobacteria bacterium]|nr:endonuclease/exonuclease/phosphatase family protein [Actinomycetota bacterium]